MNRIIVILLLLVGLYSCKEDCPISDCPRNEVPVFTFTPQDENGKFLYRNGGNTLYDFRDLEMEAFYSGGSQRLRIDTSSKFYNKLKFLTISTTLPRASYRLRISYGRGKFDEFEIVPNEASSECCGNYYTGFNFFFNDQLIESFNPYIHQVQ